MPAKAANPPKCPAAASGATAEVSALVEELRGLGPEFAALWADNDVRGHGEGVKHLKHPKLGKVAFEYSAFAVDGRTGLSMAVYNPVTAAEADAIGTLIAATAEV